MNDPSHDPYATLGISPSASDGEVRRAYRRLVQAHHPDHNGGSAESSVRFATIQEAYARIVAQRRTKGGAEAKPEAAPAAADPPPRSTPYSDSAINARLAEMERELYAERMARERARRTEQAAPPRRATPEELGQISTEDSLSKIFDDVQDELARRWSSSRNRPLSERLADLFADFDSGR